MSRCEIILFKDGKAHSDIEYSNSWGGAAYIWDSIYNEYLKDNSPLGEYDSWLIGMRRYGQAFWDLAKNETLPDFMRAAHASQFDMAMVKKENYNKFAQHLRQFAARFPVNANTVCHLPTWANDIEKLECDAIGFYPTSVGEWLWSEWDDDADEEVMYNYLEGNKHFFLYEYLAEKSVGKQPVVKIPMSY